MSSRCPGLHSSTSWSNPDSIYLRFFYINKESPKLKIVFMCTIGRSSLDNAWNCIPKLRLVASCCWNIYFHQSVVLVIWEAEKVTPYLTERNFTPITESLTLEVLNEILTHPKEILIIFTAVIPLLISRG